MKYNIFIFFRCVAWHPHVAKVALAMKDDTVQIALTSSNIKPLLKHKKQKQVRIFIVCIADTVVTR